MATSGRAWLVGRPGTIAFPSGIRSLSLARSYKFPIILAIEQTCDIIIIICDINFIPLNYIAKPNELSIRATGQE